MITWLKAGIPTILVTHSIEKLERLHDTWLLLKKNQGRKSEALKASELEFAEKLNQLFHIAHADAVTKIKIEQDKEFLNDQRTDRKMIMTTEDKELAEKQQRSEQRRQKEEERKRKASQQPSVFTAAVLTKFTQPENGRENASANAFASSDNDDATDSDGEYTPSKVSKSCKQQDQVTQMKKTSRDQLFNANVTSAFDRNKISAREVVRLLVPIAAVLGHDPNALPISRSTIQRARTSARHELFRAIKSNFKPTCPLVIHWDGKILPAIFGEGSVDRLPVLVSGDGMDKLLGVSKVSSGTGENEANAVYKLVVVATD